MSNSISQKEKSFLYKTLIIVVIVMLTIIFGFLGLRFLEKRVLYPTKYSETVIRYSNEFNLSPSVIFSVIKTESSFNKDAVSDKNAKGLMQITDKTAQYIAQKLKVESFNLFDPETNIRFGTYYLRYLIDKFKNLETAIASYNAGEGNVSLWLKNSKYSDDGVTLKTIPFSETSNYVKKFCKTYKKYRKLYGNILDKPK